jgi:hypothetical protein
LLLDLGEKINPFWTQGPGMGCGVIERREYNH